MDIGAFFIGKRFGRVKLARSISPNKTWEGLFGGLVSMTMLSVLLSHTYGIGKTVMIPFVLSLGLLSVVGDLTISMFKRNAGVKDSGRLFPGHGGLLDRIDSIISSISLYAFACSIYLF
jgi:phosphatidate cytidylyltransferase